MTRHVFRFGAAEFDYHYGSGCAQDIADAIKALGGDTHLFVTDTTVASIHSGFLETVMAACPGTLLAHQPGESMKTLDVLAADLDRAIESKMTRRSIVVAFGGGVPGNLAGVLASLLFRGIRLVHIPTTTVAAMDAVLSQKQAINGYSGKNQIGTYHVPTAVYTDIELFRTLPNRDLVSGFCEMAKNALAIVPSRIDEIHHHLSTDLASSEALQWLVDASVSAKAQVMAADAREQQRALVLEYGHTVGHAVEFWSSRNQDHLNSLSHGAAVAYGMLVAARISHKRGWLSDNDLSKHCEIVKALGVPTQLPGAMSVDQVLTYVAADNKRGYMRLTDQEGAMVLLKALGQPAATADMPLVAVSLEEVRRAVEEQESASAGSPSCYHREADDAR